MDVRLIGLLSVAVTVVFIAAGFFGVLNPLLDFIFLFGFFETLFLLLIVVALAFGVLRFDGLIRVFALGGLGIIVFVFAIFPIFFDAVMPTILLGMGLYGALLLFLLVILLPPPDIDIFFAGLLKSFFNIPIMAGEVIVLSVTFALFVVASFAFPHAWNLLIGGWTFDPVLSVVYVVLLVGFLFVADKLLGGPGEQ